VLGLLCLYLGTTGEFEKTLEELAQNMSKDIPDLPDLPDFGDFEQVSILFCTVVPLSSSSLDSSS
jgi:hypothetical protein